MDIGKEEKKRVVIEDYPTEDPRKEDAPVPEPVELPGPSEVPERERESV